MPKISGNPSQDPLRSLTSLEDTDTKVEVGSKKVEAVVEPVLGELGVEKNPPAEGGGWWNTSWLQVASYIPSWSTTRDADSADEEEEAGGSLLDTFGMSYTEENQEISYGGYLDDALAINSEGEVIKTYCAAEKTLFGSLMGRVGQTLLQVSSPVIKKIASSFNQFDKERIVSEQKVKMLSQINDPQFVEFYQLTASALLPSIREKLISISKGSDPVAEVISSQEGMIMNLLEVVLARGFANLAQQLNEHKDEIPDFDSQPSLVSIISLLTQKVGDQIDQEKLSAIERKYSKDETGLRDCLSGLFPDIDKHAESKKSLNLYIKEYIETDDARRKTQILEALFPKRDEDTFDKEAVQALAFHLDNLHKKNKELKLVFGGMSEQILLFLFPNKLNDIDEFRGNLMTLFGDFAFNFIRDSITDILKESYEPIEDSSARKGVWESDLKGVLGVDDLEPIIQAPAALMQALSKDYIQSDPSIVGAVTTAINGILNPDGKKKDDVLSQLSQQELASWMVESVQVMLNSQDPHITGLEKFVKQSLNNLTLALMTKGAKLVIPEGTTIEPKAFIKEFSDRLIEKMEVIEAEHAFSESFLNDLTADLPLPPMIRDMLVPILVEKAVKLKTDVVEKTEQLNVSRALYAEAYQKIRSYEKGEELLSITDKVTEQLVSQAFEKNLDLISAFGLGETLDELFAQYLPGVEVNEELKIWFKNNITALGMTEAGADSRTVKFIKEGIQTVFLKAMVDMIEKNFKGNSRDYAAQLLDTFHAAFSNTLEGLDKNERDQLDVALKIQAEIDKKNHELREIRSNLGGIPSGITSEQKRLLENSLVANSRESRARDYCSGLEDKRQKVLNALNSKQSIRKWILKDFSIVSEALVLRKIEEGKFNSSRAYKSDLQGKIDRLLRQKRLSTDEKEELATRQVLLALLETPPHALKLFSEAMNIQTTIEHAEKELRTLQSERVINTQKIENYGKGAVSNRQEWEAAKTWFALSLASKWKSRNLASEIALLEVELDKNLKPFQSLSKELSALLGWERKESLDLPPFLQDNVWGIVESVQDKQLARLLFSQVVPFFNSLNDMESNRRKLTELSAKNPLLGQLIDVASKEVISSIPDYFTSYKPFASEVLNAIEGREPTEEEIIRFETAFKDQVIVLGRAKFSEAASLNTQLKGHVPEGKEGEFSELVMNYISNWDDEDLKSLLAGELKAKYKKFSFPQDEAKLDRQVELLIKGVDQFLFNRGKGMLEAGDLIAAYNAQVHPESHSVTGSSIAEVEASLRERHVVEKIKRVILTPEEVAQSLNDAIPGARDLHSLIAPQLQAVIAGEDPTFKKNRKVLQDFLEGSILSLVVKVAEHNVGMGVGEDPLTVIMEKLKNLVEQTPYQKGRSREDVARHMIDKVLKDILDITSEDSLEVIPPALRQLVLEKIREQGYQVLTPLLLPIIDRKEKRELLKQESGSEFLGAICTALSNDVFSFAPALLRDHQKGIFESISAFAPQLDIGLREELVNQLKNTVSEESSSYANGAAFLSAYLESVVLDVFVGVAKKNPATPNKDSMVVLTEKLLNIVTQKYLEAKKGPESENFGKELNDAIMHNLLGIDSPAAFKGLPEGVQALVYDAVKNQIGDIVLKVQESLKLVSSGNEELRQRKEESKRFGVERGAATGYIEQLSEDVIDMVLNSALFSLAEPTGEDLKGVVSISKNVEGVVRELARGNMEIGKVLLNYTDGEQFKGLLRDKLAAIGDPKSFAEDKKMAVNLVGNVLFDVTNTAVEKTVAFGEKRGVAFTRKLMTRVLGISADHLKHLNDARALAAIDGRSTISHADFMRALDEVGDKLHPAVPRLAATYKETLKAIEDKLYPSMTVEEQATFVLKEGKFRELIAKKVNDEMLGVKLLSIEEFSEEVSKVFASEIGRPLTDEEKQALHTADEGGLNLKDIMRKEGEAFDLQRKEKAYFPAGDAILEMVFPNGKDDLNFVPEELRGTVWDLFKKNLLPVIFTTLTDVVLDPDMIKTIVLKSLENANETLREDVQWQPPQPVDRSPEARALDKVSGELIAQALRATTLPQWAQNMLKDENGEISDGIKESMGAALRNQFSDSFIKDKLETALKNAVGRDENGDPVLNFKPRDKKIRDLDKQADSKKTEKALKKAFRETIYVSIGYYLRGQWANFQHDFDELIKNACGDKGEKVKHYLDITCRKLFIEIGANILLYWLSTPIRWAVKKVMDSFIDANRERILKLLTEVPPDQPEAGLKNYALYHEDLLYKVGQALSEVVDEFINEEPILPFEPI